MKMKTTLHSSSATRCHRSLRETILKMNPKLAAILFAAALVCCAVSARAASQNWTGGSAVNGNWSTTGNWSGAAPGSTSVTNNTDVATFNAAIAHTWGNSAANPVVIDSLTQNIGGITFTTLAGNYTIGSTGGNSLLLSNAGTIQITGLTTNSNVMETVNAPLVLEGTAYTLTNASANGTGVGAGTLNIGGAISSAAASGTTVLTLSGANTNQNTISGIISDGPLATVSLNKSQAGTWVLSGNNTFTGGVSLNGGTVVLNNNAALGSTGTIAFSGGAVINSTVPGIKLNSGPWALAGSATVTFQCTRNMEVDSNVVANSSNPSTIWVSANTLTLGGIVSHSNSWCIFYKDGPGTLVLAGANTFGGTVNGNMGIVINNGVVSVSSLVSGFNNLGTGTVHFGTATTTGTLRYTGGTAIEAGLNGFTTAAAGGGEFDVVNPATTLTIPAIGLGNIAATWGFGGGGNLTMPYLGDTGHSPAASLTKTGIGTLTFTTSVGSGGYTGATNLNGGTLAFDYSSVAASTNMINASTALNFGGGNLFAKGRTGSYASVQTFASTTVNAGGGSILINPNGGTSTTLTLNALTSTAAGGSLLVGKAAGAGTGSATITTTTAKDATGIYGGRVVFTSDGGTTVDWASTASGSSPYTLGAYGSYTASLPTTVSTDTNNSKITAGQTQTGNVTTNSLKIENPAANQSLALGANTLTLTNGGLLATGANATQITGNTGVTGLTAGNGSGAYDLVVHQYNTGGLTVSAVIGDNSGNATSLTKAGASTLKLTGANTYTGATYINAGTLQIGDNGTAGSLNPTGAINIATGGTLQFNRTDSIVQGTDFSNTITGAGSVTHAGTGTVTLGSTGNSYTGATTVSGNGGKLIVSGSLSGSAVTVNGDANTTLSGNGGIAQNVTITLGRIAPGLNNTGANNNFGVAGTFTLATSGSLTLTSANLDFDLATTAAGTSDQIVTGALSLGSTVAFTFNALTPANLQTGVAYTLIHTTVGGITGFNTGNITTNWLNGDGSNYSAAYTQDGTNLLVTFAAIPEPQTWVMLISGVGMLTMLRRRRS